MERYDVVIIGGGVVGTALLYVLSRYTNIEKIMLIEKYSKFGQVNSNKNNNSQTLHFGDIETNYNLEKAKRVNEAASMVKQYLKNCDKSVYIKTHKIVLGVGHEQVELLKTRYMGFKKLFPKLKLINQSEIWVIEPMVLEGRDKNEEIIALYSDDGYGVNYDILAENFVKNAKKERSVEVKLNEKVEKIIRKNQGYEVITSKEIYNSKLVVVCSGSHSLLFAKSLGYGKELGILPVAGSFFGTKKKFLNGKVYTIQIERLPFAAIHGDPYVDNINETRFGPTAKVLPLLERHNYFTVLDFLKTSVWNFIGIISLFKILFDPIIFKYVLKNVFYDFPVIGKRLFVKEIKKIVPTLKYSDLEYKKGYGGIRPQVVNWKKMKLQMGDAKIYGENIIFNITPSPGASVCLKNAELDTRKILYFFKENFGENYLFYEKKFKKDLLYPIK